MCTATLVGTVPHQSGVQVAGAMRQGVWYSICQALRRSALLCATALPLEQVLHWSSHHVMQALPYASQDMLQ